MNHTTASTPSSASSTGVAANRTDVPDIHQNHVKYLASLDRWATTEDNGLLAVSNIKQWLDNGNINAILDISNMKLKSLPPLPGNLKKLKAGNNELASIPENHLPATLEAIDIHGNQLTSLPESMPISQLKLLNAADNELTGLPLIAHNLHRECKVYLGKNSIDPALLASLFGPEQNINGMRRTSTVAAFTISQVEALKTLMVAISAWIPTEGLSLELFAKDVSGTKLLTNFLDKMQKAPYVKNANLKAAIKKIINKTSADLALCTESFELLTKSPNLSTHRLACLFFKLKQLVIYSDIKNGLYNGRPADLVAFKRQEFRSNAIYYYVSDRLKPEHRNSQQSQDELWGDIATFISPFINFELEIDPVNTTTSNSALDIIELTQVVPNHIKDLENKQFPTYFADDNANFFHLLKIADPRIAEILNEDTDSDGTTFQGEKLEQFRVKNINDYFAQIGQPDLLGQVWPTIEDPNNFSIPLDQCNLSISSQVDLTQLSPEQRQQVEKCLIQ